MILRSFFAPLFTIVFWQLFTTVQRCEVGCGSLPSRWNFKASRCKWAEKVYIWSPEWRFFCSESAFSLRCPVLSVRSRPLFHSLPILEKNWLTWSLTCYLEHNTQFHFQVSYWFGTLVFFFCRYINEDPQIVPMLKMLRQSGRMTFLVTNRYISTWMVLDSRWVPDNLKVLWAWRDEIGNGILTIL